MKIDKNIPLPANAPNGKPFKYPWHELKIGDSLYIDHQNSISGLIQNYNSTLPKDKKIKVTRRIEGTGQRVWRIK